jgi:hypothetical protein
MGRMASIRTIGVVVISNYLILAIGVLAFALALVAILTHRRSEQIKEWIVGATAGLDFVQLAHVHLFTIAVLFWLLTSKGFAWRKTSLPMIALLLSAAILGLTAFVGPLSVNHTLELQLLALAVSAAIIGLKADREAILQMAYGLLAVCLFSACWAILQKFGFLPIHAFNSVEGTSRVMGIYREPDWLGLFCAAGIVTTLRLDLTRLQTAACLSILGVALIFSLARGSVIALGLLVVVSAVAGLLRRPDLRRRARNRQVVLIFAGVLTVVLVLSPSIAGRLASRFQTGFTSAEADVGARARTLQVQSLNLLARNAPWYGDGFSASGRVRQNGTIVYGVIPTSNAVSTNWVLGWWVDGKYLALPLIAIFCLLALRYLNELGGQLLFVVLVTSLVSDAVMLPLTWFAIGLCLSKTIPETRAEQNPGLEWRPVTTSDAVAG